MKNPFVPGDIKAHRYIVQTDDLAAFGSGVVHPVCSTFTLGREMEWSSRMFILEMIEDDEEAVGISLSIDHQSPAIAGEELRITAILDKVIDHKVLCRIEVRVKNRLIATGQTGQKILKKTKIASLLDGL